MTPLAVHDRVVVRAEVDGRSVSLMAVVVNLAPGGAWLGLALPDALLERFRPGDPVQLVLGSEGGASRAATFRARLGAGRARLFAINWREETPTSQRRAFLRLSVECPVEYTVVTQSDRSIAGQGGVGYTHDISAGGLQFEVDAPMDETVAVGDGLELLINFDHDVVMAEAEVVRVSDAATDDGEFRQPRTMIAVRFVAIDEGARDRIVRHIFERLRHRRDVPTDPPASGQDRAPRAEGVAERS